MGHITGLKKLVLFQTGYPKGSGEKSINPHEIKKQFQTILGDGLVVIVGCGLSSAGHGLAGEERRLCGRIMKQGRK